MKFFNWLITQLGGYTQKEYDELDRELDETERRYLKIIDGYEKDLAELSESVKTAKNREEAIRKNYDELIKGKSTSETVYEISHLKPFEYEKIITIPFDINEQYANDLIKKSFEPIFNQILDDCLDVKASECFPMNQCTKYYARLRALPKTNDNYTI